MLSMAKPGPPPPNSPKPAGSAPTIVIRASPACGPSLDNGECQKSELCSKAPISSACARRECRRSERRPGASALAHGGADAPGSVPRVQEPALPMDHRRPHPSRDDAPSAERRKKSRPGPPMTLGGAAAAGVRLIVWCRGCGHRVEPDPAEQARRYGAGTPVLDWCERLVCSECGGREVDFVVTGTARR